VAAVVASCGTAPHMIEPGMTVGKRRRKTCWRIEPFRI
jgi:hypothetical protein